MTGRNIDQRGKKQNRRKTGAFYEKEAGVFLESKGYRILEYNFHCRYAEIDIVAAGHGYLVFCEVKYREKGTESSALEAVGSAKQRRISKAALFYLAVHGYSDIPCRFDVIGITDGELTWISNAFEYTGG